LHIFLKRSELESLPAETFLDDVVLEAHREDAEKPPDLTLEQWLYQIANRKLDRYIAKQVKADQRRRSLETLGESELGTLEELPLYGWTRSQSRCGRRNGCTEPSLVLSDNGVCRGPMSREYDP
jgi:hypothetical protein